MSPEAPAAVFAALGDATRLALVARLASGEPRSIAQLSAGLAQTRQGVTKHLQVLEAAGVVARRRAGRETRYTIRPAPVAAARLYLDRVARQWDEAAERLRTFVEEGER